MRLVAKNTLSTWLWVETCCPCQCSNQPTTLQHLNAFRHVGMVKIFYWLLNSESVWERGQLSDLEHGTILVARMWPSFRQKISYWLTSQSMTMCSLQWVEHHSCDRWGDSRRQQHQEKEEENKSTRNLNLADSRQNIRGLCPEECVTLMCL